jgi:hypothetical protein
MRITEENDGLRVRASTVDGKWGDLKPLHT